MDLGERRVGEQRAPPVCPPARRDVAALGVGRQVEHVAVAAAGQHHGVGQVDGHRAGLQVAHHDAAGPAVDHDQVEHLVPGVHGDGAGADLPLQRLVRAEQQLLTRLAAGVEGARDLRAAEGAGVQQAAVLAGERHALRHALVDDLDGDLGQPVHVGLARPEVAALDGVVEEPLDRVTVVAVVLGGVDAALRGDRVRPPRAVLVAVAAHPVAELAQRRGGRTAGQPAAHHDHVEPAPVGRVDQPAGRAPLGPPLRERPVRRRGVGDRVAVDEELTWVRHSGPTHPTSTANGTARKPTQRRIAKPSAAIRASRSPFALRWPRVRSALNSPCRTWKPIGDHGQRVEQGHRPPAGRETSHHVGVRGRRVADGVDGADGQVEQVPDQEQQDDHAAPAHRPGGVAALHLGAVRVADRAGPLGPQRQDGRGPGVADQRGGQHEPLDPQEPLVRERRGADVAQPVRVVVERLGAEEDLQVARHVQRRGKRRNRSPVTAMTALGAYRRAVDRLAPRRGGFLRRNRRCRRARTRCHHAADARLTSSHASNAWR